MYPWTIPVLLAVGGLLAVQAAANVQLSAAVRSSLGAAALQLAVGAAVLLAAVVAVGATPELGLLADVTPWHLLGGLGSAVYITAGILLFPRLGAVVTVGLFIAGQMFASLVLDAFGLLGVAREPLRLAALAGVLAVLAGAALIVRAQVPASVRTLAASGVARPGVGAAVLPPGRAAPTTAVGRRAGWLALAAAGGAVLPFQGAVNALLRADLGSPPAVAAVSFVLATVAMGVVLLVGVRLGAVAPPRLRRLGTVPWWGWLGGLVGAVYVTSVFLLIPLIGAAPTVALTVAGQQLAGVVVDQFGLLRLPRRPVGAQRLLGVGVLLAGVALLQLA